MRGSLWFVSARKASHVKGLGARGPRAWSRALIPFAFSFHRNCQRDFSSCVNYFSVMVFIKMVQSMFLF